MIAELYLENCQVSTIAKKHLILGVPREVRGGYATCGWIVMESPAG
jgi:hypothetical protein